MIRYSQSFTFIITLWSCWSSNRLSVECASICWRIAVAMGATKLTGFRSKSSHTDSANCSGVIRVSEKKKKKKKIPNERSPVQRYSSTKLVIWPNKNCGATTAFFELRNKDAMAKQVGKRLIPFLFQVKQSRSFWPSYSMSSLMGISTSSFMAFSWTSDGSLSSKLQNEKLHCCSGNFSCLFFWECAKYNKTGKLHEFSWNCDLIC